MQLIENTYFALVVTAMQEQGFKLFSQVTISNQDTPYHVPVGTARVTSLFFHLPSRNLIVRLAYNENDSGGEPSAYWTIRIDKEFALHASVLNLYCPRGSDGEPVDWANDVIACEGFRHNWSSSYKNEYTWNLEQDDTSGPPLDPQVLAGYMGKVLTKLRQHLRSTPFDKLQVTSWGPTYQFRDCEALFWRRFSQSAHALTRASNYLWTIVRKPWGGGLGW